MHINCECQVVSRLGLIVAGLSPQGPHFIPRLVRVGCVVNGVALGQVSLPVLWFYPVHIISPIMRLLLTLYHLID
jgi:hypothetical protein